MKLRLIIGVVTVILTLLLLWWLEQREAHSQDVPERQHSVYDKKLDRLDRRGTDAAYTNRVALLYTNWMTDTTQESQNRALKGHRKAQDIYIKIMTAIDARDPEGAEK